MFFKCQLIKTNQRRILVETVAYVCYPNLSFSVSFSLAVARSKV